MPITPTKVIAKEPLPNIMVHNMQADPEGGVKVKLQIGHILIRGARYYPAMGGDFVTMPTWTKVGDQNVPACELTEECTKEVLRACSTGWALYGPGVAGHA